MPRIFDNDIDNIVHAISDKLKIKNVDLSNENLSDLNDVICEFLKNDVGLEIFPTPSGILRPNTEFITKINGELLWVRLMETNEVITSTCMQSNNLDFDPDLETHDYMLALSKTNWTPVSVESTDSSWRKVSSFSDTLFIEVLPNQIQLSNENQLELKDEGLKVSNQEALPNTYIEFSTKFNGTSGYVRLMESYERVTTDCMYAQDINLEGKVHSEYCLKKLAALTWNPVTIDKLDINKCFGKHFPNMLFIEVLPF